MPSASKSKREEQRKEKQKTAATKNHAPTAPMAACGVSSQLIFPPSLTPRQRAILHTIGENHGLYHESSGDGMSRQITLGAANGSASRILKPPMNGDVEVQLSDQELIAMLLEHLSIDASSEFASDGRTQHGSTIDPKRRESSHLASPKETGSQISGNDETALAQIDIENFVCRMQKLVEMERRAEVAVAEAVLSSNSISDASHAAAGRVLANLRLREAEGGLLGRTLLTLVRNKGGSQGDVSLPQHKISPHDIIRLRPSKSDGAAAMPSLVQGVVYRVKEDSITIAVDEMPDEGLDVPLKLEKLANEVTYDRLKQALADLARGGPASGGGNAGPLIDVLFGRRPPRFSSSSDHLVWRPVNETLDASQKDAVSKALVAADVALIHGPPGTGKTTAVVEVIAQEVIRGSRVLACAASNIAVDNLVERLASVELPASNKGRRAIGVVRVGHPARLLPKVLDNSLEAKVLHSDDSALAKDCRNEIREINKRLMKLGRKDRAERMALRKDLRQLAKEEKKRQERAVSSVLSSAQVICATLTGVGTRQLSQLPPFDIVVIDEAAQALEPACWAALLRGRKAVLAGDHLQLPPTVTSEEAAKGGLLTTLFERCHTAWGPASSVMLDTQYRMNEKIMRWSSNELYDGKLVAHETVAGHTLGDLPIRVASSGGDGAAAVTADELPVLLLIDTAGCGMDEGQGEGSESKCSPREAEVAMAHVRRLLAAGISAKDIGVITPYSAQVAMLRDIRNASCSAQAAGALEISTVDGFQGREKEAVVISMVRSNNSGEVGFLADNRRMNVAVTRARRHCCIICDSDTVKADAFLGRLVRYFEDNGEYECAEEVLQIG